MENELNLLEIIKGYNEEKNTIVTLMKDFDPKYQRYQDYQKRILEIDNILKELLK